MREISTDPDERRRLKELPEVEQLNLEQLNQQLRSRAPLGQGYTV